MTDLKNAGKAIKDTIDNVHDSASEAMHRSSADAERARRDLAGDTMSTTDKVTSIANETKERVGAEMDRTKVEVRNRT